MEQKTVNDLQLRKSSIIFHIFDIIFIFSIMKLEYWDRASYYVYGFKLQCWHVPPIHMIMSMAYKFYNGDVNYQDMSYLPG